MSDTLLTVRDVAAILQSGEDAVIRRFAKMEERGNYAQFDDT